MSATSRYVTALAAAFASLAVEQAAARGSTPRCPASAPAITGRNSANPSAAASSVNPNANNLSAAPSAVTTLNGFNRSATPSTLGGSRR